MRRDRALILAMLVFCCATTFSIYKIVREYEIISEKFIPNLWVAAQAEIEFLRFTNQLALSVENPGEPSDALEKRLYVLLSRLPLLLQGTESQHVRAVPGAIKTIGEFRATLEQLEPEIVSLR